MFSTVHEIIVDNCNIGKYNFQSNFIRRDFMTNETCGFRGCTGREPVVWSVSLLFSSSVYLDRHVSWLTGGCENGHTPGERLQQHLVRRRRNKQHEERCTTHTHTHKTTHTHTQPQTHTIYAIYT
jgi:hypothetical protein